MQVDSDFIYTFENSENLLNFNKNLEKNSQLNSNSATSLILLFYIRGKYHEANLRSGTIFKVKIISHQPTHLHI
jgi:predicted amino acid racemase